MTIVKSGITDHITIPGRYVGKAVPWIVFPRISKEPLKLILLERMTNFEKAA